jgi:hypothetical protein
MNEFLYKYKPINDDANLYEADGKLLAIDVYKEWKNNQNL